MRVINARNVHNALPEGMYQLYTSGNERTSRNGPVVVMPTPVTTVYKNPKERVLFWHERDANPFFHLMESLWMLGGRADVEWIASFLKQMRKYSDDGVTYNGAYGHRWRSYFGFDQLTVLIRMLKKHPDTRRAVLQIWGIKDLVNPESRDLPCNTQVYFARDGEALNMTVCNRSNDIIWGCYGANAVHFSMLQEVIASGVGCEVGGYWQMSNNFHAYKDVFHKMIPLVDKAADVYDGKHPCPYETQIVKPFPVVSIPIDEWFSDLKMFLEEGPVLGLREPFFKNVAIPMERAYRIYQGHHGRERYTAAIEVLDKHCMASDWSMAGIEWLMRRLKKFDQADDDGVTYD